MSSGRYNIDDQNYSVVTYTGTWVRGGTTHEYADTTSSSTNVGDYFTVTFTGNVVYVFGTLDSTSAGVLTSYSIDNGPDSVATGQQVSADTYQQLFWGSDILNDGNHTMKVTMTKVNPSSTYDEGTVWFDYFQIVNLNPTTTIVSSSSSTTSVASLSQSSHQKSANGASTTITTTISGSVVTTTVATGHSSSNSASTSTSSGHNAPIGAIVGGVIGGLIALLILAFLVVYMRRKNHLGKDRDADLPPTKVIEAKPHSGYGVDLGAVDQPLMGGGNETYTPYTDYSQEQVPQGYPYQMPYDPRMNVQPHQLYDNPNLIPMAMVNRDSMQPRPSLSSVSAGESGAGQQSHFSSSSSRPLGTAPPLDPKRPLQVMSYEPPPTVQAIDSGIRSLDPATLDLNIPVEVPPVYTDN